MQHSRRAQFLASTAGVLLLTLLVVVAALLYSPESFWFTAGFGCTITFLLTFAAWSGVLWQGKRSGGEPKSWGEWLGLFFGGALFSAFFLYIDIKLAEGHPGFSAIFTVAALATTFIALPSALRAWLLAKLAVEHNDA